MSLPVSLVGAIGSLSGLADHRQDSAADEVSHRVVGDPGAVAFIVISFLVNLLIALLHDLSD